MWTPRVLSGQRNGMSASNNLMFNGTYSTVRFHRSAFSPPPMLVALEPQVHIAGFWTHGFFEKRI